MVGEGKSVLIFCSSKDGCEKCALNIASLMASDPDLDVKTRRNEVLIELNKTPTGVDPYLERCILAGVAYHHAGI